MSSPANACDPSSAGPRGHPRARGGVSHGRHHLPYRVRDLVRSAVLQGWYSSDDQLIEEVLVHTHAASRNAVRHALQQLLAEGIVTRSPRRGTYPSWDGVRLHMIDVHSTDGTVLGLGRHVERKLVPATRFLKEKLQTDDDLIRMVETTSELHGQPLGMRTAYFSSRYDIVGLMTREQQPNTLAGVIAGIFDRELGYVTTEVSASLADGKIARVLDIAEGSPVLRREQLVRDSVGQPIEIAFDSFRADRTTFVLSDFGSGGSWVPQIDGDLPLGREEGD